MPVPQVHAVTDEEIAAAIDRLKAALYKEQDQNIGGWFGEYHTDPKQTFDGTAKTKNVGGPTAIATLALLVSGESFQKPQLDKAIRYMQDLEFGGTYAMSLKVHAWSYLPDSFLSNLERDAAALMQGATPEGSTFDYLFYEPSKRIDHSTTQYGMLAMWQAAQRGGRIPSSFWQKAEQHWYKAQFKDGSWGYTMAENSSRATMTCAGLTVLYVIQQELYRDKDTPPANLTESINRGLAWMDKSYKADHSAHGGNGYYMYGVERVGLASGLKFFRTPKGDADWFQDIAAKIVKANSNSVVNNSFYLMFLSRGRVPVWITKLQMPGVNWNNRPNDLYFLTKFLSDAREQELNWQSIPIDIDPEHWINAPMAYLASDQAIEFTDEQKNQIKKFIDLGGTLLCNPDKGSAAFEKSIAQLAADLYPQYKLEPLPAKHPLYNALYTVRQYKFKGVSNGTRDLILLADSDIGKGFQQDTRYETNDLWKLALNLFTLASDRGVLTNRLVKVIPDHPDNAGGEYTLARAQYEGNWNPEPGAWWPISARLAAGQGFALKPVDVKLEDLSSTDATLAHLAGIEPVQLSDAQKAAIEAYVKRGGTILIENVGGRGTFSIEMDKQLREVFKTPSVPLQNTEPLISGAGLAGGVNCSSVGYRRHALLNQMLKNTPRLAAFRVDNRPAVLISHEDLSMGSLRARQLGISGYQPESARGLMTNIVLWARSQKVAEAEAAAAAAN